MSHQSQLLDLFCYNQWANKLFYPYLKLPDSSSKRILSLFSHISAAQIIWASRLLGKENVVAPFEQFPENEILFINQESNEILISYIQKLEESELNGVCVYTNSDGTKFESTISEILTHLVNHGTHHRGQLSMILRQEGFAPPVTDYIAYLRSK